jgi:multidrug efflux pump
MPQFFINRPVFAWVIALFIVLVGLIAIPQLPIARYPSVAPPSVTLYATYPGATPQTLNDSVVSLVERELSGVKNLLYFESSVDTSGTAQITVTFKPGTDPELAQVDVQNRIKAVEPRLPQAVRQNGLQVESAASGFLMMVGMTSPNGQYDEVALNDYLARNIVQELRRIDGVGRVQLFGAEQAMRVWVDPQQLTAYGLTMNELAQAIEQQNVQIAPGRVGDEPALPGQRLTVPLTVQGQLSTPEQFAAVVLRAGADGAKVVLGDVARIELGAQSYAFSNRENGVAATSAAIQLSPGANAVRTASAVRERLAELAPSMPAGMAYSVPFDTAPFVKVSIEKVIYTLFEAMALVFLVMFVFLQNLRYTLIPAIVAPIALLGTFAVMLLAGFSINSLTMFGMVLAIGIIVDDAIVVVENVERLMATQGLSPKEATLQAMREITGAIIGITLVLTAVFIPMAFGSGSVGVIYQQFTLSMAVSILFSAFLALSLTPALCATLLRPVSADHHEKRGFFGAFNRGFERMTASYGARVARLVGRSGRMMAAFAVLCAVLAVAAAQLPSSFLPEEDQGYFMTSIQLPTGATSERTLDVVKAYEAHVASRPGLDANLVVLGFSFAGSGPNAAIAFTMLKDWNQRHGATAAEEAALAQQAMAGNVEGTVMSLMPPAIDELGTSSGFTLFLQDRANRGEAALLAAQAQLLALAAQSKVVSDVYPDGLPPGESIRLQIDRQKAEAMGLSFSAVSSTLSAAMGSLYVKRFPQCRAHAAGHPAGRRRGAHATGRRARPARAQCRRRHGGAARGGDAGVERVAAADDTFSGVSRRAYRRRCGCRGFQRCGDGRDGTPGRPVTAGLRRGLDRAVAAGTPVGGAGTAGDAALGAGGVPGAGGALRELVDPAVGDVGSAAGPARRGGRGDAARHAQRRVLQGGDDHHHRPVGEERHPHRRVRPSVACRGGAR